MPYEVLEWYVANDKALKTRSRVTPPTGNT